MIKKHIVKAWLTRGGKYSIEIENINEPGFGHYVTSRTNGEARSWYGPVSLAEAVVYAEKRVATSREDNINYAEVKPQKLVDHLGFKLGYELA